MGPYLPKFQRKRQTFQSLLVCVNIIIGLRSLETLKSHSGEPIDFPVATEEEEEKEMEEEEEEEEEAAVVMKWEGGKR